jgi:hydroxymethylpyrimidine/phosphomethylpyrimidine kinase
MDQPPSPNGADSRVYRRVLTIAGSDSGGGAGIQADLKTFAALECYGSSAITALTAQNTLGVRAIHPVPPEFAAAQIAAVFEDIGADAVKIGMLYSARLIRIVAEELHRYRARNVVLDPVMVAQSGDRLLESDAVGAIREHLMPLAEIVTPNVPEAEVLTGRRIGGLAEMQAAARDLAGHGSRAVMLKGGHLETADSSDLLYLCRDDRWVTLPAERIPSRNTHGTGCTLSSAIAAYLARGEELEAAVRRAKTYITAALQAGAPYRLGSGHGPVHHFFGYWK